MAKQPDFSPEEMAQVQRHGKALLGEPTDFDEAVEEHLADHYPHEASFKKMRAAQTGGASVGLGPSEMEQQQIKQRDTSQQQTAAMGAQQASQAQAQQTPPTPPPAPTGPTGVTQPYPAQSAPQPPPSATAGLPQPGEGEEEPEQGPPS
jgi:hypothetical protein